MQRIFYVITLALCLISCKSEKYIWADNDMFFFIDNKENGGTLTTIETMEESQLDLWVMRDLSLLERKPKQKARIIIDEKLSTAKNGKDFTISLQDLYFNGKTIFKIPFQVNILRNASGKQIILRLDYEYYDESNPEGRKLDKLTINIK